MHYTASVLVVSVALASLLLVIPNTNSAFACTCISPGTPVEELNRSAAVFSGEVVDISEDGYLEEQYGYEVKFDVEKSWKGDSVETLTVLTGYGGGDCGYGFEIGEKYLVYAYSSEGSLNANICSRTAPLANAQEDLGALGAEWKIYKAKYEDKVFKIPYRFANGNILKIEVDPDFTSIIAWIESRNDSTIEITIPRDLVDPRTEGLYGDDDEFIVLVDGEEVDTEETNKSPCFRTLLISVPGGAEEIEFIGTFVMSVMNIQQIIGAPPIFFTTEKVIDYIEGEEIRVSGCTNLSLDDKEVLLEVLDPEAKAYRTVSVTPNRDGSFSALLVVGGELAANDNYTIQATYAGYTAVPEFPVSMIILGISFVGLLVAARLFSSTNKHNVY